MSGWIEKARQLPTLEDCDEHGCILAWHEMSGANIVHLSVFCRYGTYYTHWMKLPGAPA